MNIIKHSLYKILLQPSRNTSIPREFIYVMADSLIDAFAVGSAHSNDVVVSVEWVDDIYRGEQ